MTIPIWQFLLSTLCVWCMGIVLGILIVTHPETASEET